MSNVLVLGSGAREHALCWKLAQSNQVGDVYCGPGNGGTASSFQNAGEIDLKHHDGIVSWCKEHSVEMVVVGPEDPLAAGIVDHVTANGILCFGPSGKAAQLESSKTFSKLFMDRNGIPTARWSYFTESSKAKDHIMAAEYPALVVKASGLAAGKGVVVAKSKEEAVLAVEEMLDQGKFAAAGETVVVEELLDGYEVSILGFSDGKVVSCLPPAQDHKRLLDGNEGPNTGGMGAYAPCPLISKDDITVVNQILQDVVTGMANEGIPYKGILYAGLMMTKAGPRVLEFNCRMGDPETQVLLPLLDCDLYLLMKQCVEGGLTGSKVKCVQDTYAVGVVLASKGYPGSYEKGKTITGVASASQLVDGMVFHAGTKTSKDGGDLVTNGGRVLTVVAKRNILAEAAFTAQVAASKIDFEGKVWRKDIAVEGITSLRLAASLTYKDSGVDTVAGENLVNTIKPGVRSTSRPGCVAELGGFGGVFDLKVAGFTDPLLISGTDGVGTKLQVAKMANRHDTVGIDLVAMCVNDILCHGAEPLYFLDYYASSQLDVTAASQVIEGITKGCLTAGCALLGGETAEMPGLYCHGDYDLAGFAVGAVERNQYLPKTEKIEENDIVLGVASSGVHSNGFSLVRRVIEHWNFTYEMTCPWDSTKTIGDALLTPTKIYCKSLLPVLQQSKVKALAHITGGGLFENIPRVLPDELSVQLDAEKWKVLDVFKWIREKGNVDVEEMARTFNLGIGMVLIVSPANETGVLRHLTDVGETVKKIGTVTKLVKGESKVKIENLNTALDIKSSLKHKASEDISSRVKRLRINSSSDQKKRVAVLISGTGTNLQALINATQADICPSAEIALVISNKADVVGLKRAEAANIKSKVVSHKNYESREAFDDAVSEILDSENIDIVCLAGFMRILSEGFVKKWNGRLLNIHPSLLPSFKGIDAHKQVLSSGVRITGCTVHFVAKEVDAGAILVQEPVQVFPNDTETDLADRVKKKEHLAYPRALELVASGRAKLKDARVVWS